MDGPIIFDKLCEVCKSLFDEETSKSILSRGAVPFMKASTSSSLAALTRGGEAGCHLCQMLKTSLYADQKRLFSLHHSREMQISVTGIQGPSHRYSQFGISISHEDMPGLIRQTTICKVSARKIENLKASRVTPHHTLSDSSLRQIKNWITGCIRDHKQCQNIEIFNTKSGHENLVLPTRLLEVSSVDGRVHLRVRDTDDLNPKTEYVTLSHCWGHNPIISLLDSNVVEFQRSIPLDKLSKTFQDTVELTRRLGYQYLWIDSLCIIQKSSIDWHKESSMIGSIYSNAILNIAATASVDGNGGLFQRKNPLALHPCRLHLKKESSDGSEYINCRLQSWNDSVDNAPLARRAWVVQERMLSRRILHFADDQIYWECRSCRDSEFLPGKYCSRTIVRLMATRLVDSVKIYHHWEQTVQQYTSCLLTFESDKFVALAGLARRVAVQLGVEATDYLAGIWKGDMPRGLLWRTVPYGQRCKRVPERAPSWSWGCINGPIMLPRSGNYAGESLPIPTSHNRFGITLKETYSQLISTDIKHLGDPFATVTGGSIIIRGPICAIQTIGPKGRNSVVELSRGRLECKDDVVSIMTSSIRWDDEAACLEGMATQVCFLMIEESFGWCDGLVLQPIDLGLGCYQRLGQIMARPSSLTDLLDISRNPNLLGSQRYIAADPTSGFTIEII